MRGHGVTNFPDPGAGGGGLNITGTGIDPSSPAFKAARATCRKRLPGGGPPAHASEQDKERFFAISRCMRDHGVTGFPDPTTTPPANPGDYAFAEGIARDLFLLVPNTIDVDSPAFKRAAVACNLG
jgi:hypothetical protein